VKGGVINKISAAIDGKSKCYCWFGEFGVEAFETMI